MRAGGAVLTKKKIDVANVLIGVAYVRTMGSRGEHDTEPQSSCGPASVFRHVHAGRNSAECKHKTSRPAGLTLLELFTNSDHWFQASL